MDNFWAGRSVSLSILILRIGDGRCNGRFKSGFLTGYCSIKMHVFAVQFIFIDLYNVPTNCNPQKKNKIAKVKDIKQNCKIIERMQMQKINTINV